MALLIFLVVAFFTVRWLFKFIEANNARPITEANPLKMKGLTLYPNRLQYKDIRCNLNDITHLGWAMTVTNSTDYNTKLVIKIKNIKKNIELSNSTFFIKPKSLNVYQHLVEATFENRLNFYAKQLEKNGRFSYDGCYIYSDGTVIPLRKSKEKSFHLSMATKTAFQMSFKQQGLFSSDFIISLFYDREVVLTLIEYILKNPVDPEEFVQEQNYRQSTTEKSNLLIKYLIAVLAKMSIADGHIDPEEVAVIKQFLLEVLEVDNTIFQQAISTFNETKQDNNSFAYYAYQLKYQIEDNAELAIIILDLLFSVAIADGNISIEEELLILEAEKIFEQQSYRYQEFKGYSQSHQSENKDKNYYLAKLNLSTDATKQEIRRAYKRLVTQYHPDKVHHLGEEYVKEAEIKMKEINEAYEFLMKNS
ncbi:MAG: TerB family tellurite resistance protein [Moraxellaceae bacterium]|nr:TerB family tellurite resistance protein [Moraxellaceae bacterium]